MRPRVHLVCFLLALLGTCVGGDNVHRARADTFGSGANSFDIEFVTVGDPGNAADTTGSPNPAGKVDYSYRIGKFEISEQMIDKANALGGLGITHNNRGENKPATGVGWIRAARFVNWLNTSTGHPPAYKFAVQPGEAGYDTDADIELWTISDAGYNPNNLYRNSLARYFLPSADEWYKAAYYDPTSGVYYDYPTGSDIAPTPVTSGTAAGTAVYAQSFATGPSDITLAGGLSPYGTMGQGGNVREHEETDFDLMNDGVGTPPFRGMRGGDYSSLSNAVGLSSSNRSMAQVNRITTNGLGFRVASTIPEPSTLLLAAVAGLGLLWRRRRIACVTILTALVGVSFAGSAYADTFGSGVNSFDIEFVTIGNPGNVADTTGSPNPAGKVDYTYRIGKFEISEQMIDKANALGGLGITHNNRGPNQPVTSISWNEAARFVNWLNTSTGNMPAYKFAVQPGEAGYDANANIDLWTNSDAGFDPSNLYRNSLARYFLPSVDEWYKAAYYDPVNDVYYDYPTESGAAPTAVVSGTAADTAVYDQSGMADIALAGGLSAYGTMGQGGNVWEQEETDFDLVNDSPSSVRGFRGGFWGNFGSGTVNLLSSSRRFFNNNLTSVGGTAVGFRVASAVPEPSALLLFGMGSLPVLWRRRYFTWQ